MLRIHAPTSTGQCHVIGKPNVATDKSDPEAYVLDFKLRFEIESMADAQAWHGTDRYPVMPVLGPLYGFAKRENNETGWRFDYKGNDALVLDLAPYKHHEDTGKATIESAPCEVSKAQATMSNKASFVDVWCTVAGIIGPDVERYLALLRGEVHIETSNANGDEQQDMFEDLPAEPVAKAAK